MDVRLQINSQSTQFEQMAQQFGLEPKGNQITIPPSFGSGFIRYYSLPYQIQVHHYRYNLNQEIEVQGINPADTGLYMINVNLSNRILSKNIGDEPMQLSRAGGSGMLFYSPGFNSRGKNEIGAAYEVLFFSFPKETLNLINESSFISDLSNLEKFCIYDELQEETDNQIRNWFDPQRSRQNLFQDQGMLLQILGKILDQFNQRESAPSSKLKIQDVERQFMAREILMNHIYGNPPAINELAEILHVSPSKLKSDFKSVFGKSVYNYYLSKKMEVAKELISRRSGTVAEIGYQLGYSNISQFSAQFKKHFGRTPSQFLA